MKVLIVSHNCFSTTQNMGKTFLSLFNQFKKNELMQIYLYPSVPNVDVCKSYFRITDADVLRSVIKRRHCGFEIFADVRSSGGLFESADTEKRYNAINRKSSLARRVRDMVWKLGNWRSKELKNWLKSVKPDVVFYALGDAAFSQNIAAWISKFLNIPLVTYVCDDFYFSGKTATGLERLINAPMLANIKKTIKRSELLISICDELGELYKKEFKAPYKTIMTGSSFEANSLSGLKKNKQISYIGNLGLNRWKSLLDIKGALDEINLKNNDNYELVYYGRENENLIGKIVYGGFLDNESIKKVMAESLLLVHTESFDEISRDRVRYSISTKIADSLASGTCLLAYGPADIASMEHLMKNDCAYCITAKEDLYDRLSFILENPAQRFENARKGCEVAQLYHNTEKNGKFLYELISDIVNK